MLMRVIGNRPSSPLHPSALPFLRPWMRGIWAASFMKQGVYEEWQRRAMWGGEIPVVRLIRSQTALAKVLSLPMRTLECTEDIPIARPLAHPMVEDKGSMTTMSASARGSAKTTATTKVNEIEQLEDLDPNLSQDKKRDRPIVYVYAPTAEANKGIVWKHDWVPDELRKEWDSYGGHPNVLLTFERMEQLAQIQASRNEFTRKKYITRRGKLQRKLFCTELRLTHFVFESDAVAVAAAVVVVVLKCFPNEDMFAANDMIRSVMLHVYDLSMCAL